MSSSQSPEHDAETRPVAGRKLAARSRSVALIAGASAFCGVGLAAAGVTLMRAFEQAKRTDAVSTIPHPNRVASTPAELPRSGPLPPPTNIAPVPAEVPMAASSQAPAPAGALTVPQAAGEAKPTPGAAAREAARPPEKPAWPNAARAEIASKAEPRPGDRAKRQGSASPTPVRSAREGERVPSGLTRAPAPAGSASNVRAYTFASDGGTRNASGVRVVRVEVPTSR